MFLFLVLRYHSRPNACSGGLALKLLFVIQSHYAFYIHHILLKLRALDSRADILVLRHIYN